MATTCTRSACARVILNDDVHAHLDTGEFYCRQCARKINAACANKVGIGENMLVVPLNELAQARAKRERARERVRKGKLRKAVIGGVHALWRQRRVMTDPDMSILLDAWASTPDCNVMVRPDGSTFQHDTSGLGFDARLFEIADKSNGRIVVETSEQLTSDGLIAAVWERAPQPAPDPLHTTGIFAAIANARPVPGPARFLGSCTAIAKRPAVHDEIGLVFEPMFVEKTGTAHYVTIHGKKGEQLFVVDFPQALSLCTGDTFQMSDDIDTFLSHTGRPRGKFTNPGGKVAHNPAYDLDALSKELLGYPSTGNDSVDAVGLGVAMMSRLGR